MGRFFVNLYRLPNDTGTEALQLINLLKIANNELPRVERVIDSRKLNALESDKMDIQKQIFNLHCALNDYRSAIREQTA